MSNQKDIIKVRVHDGIVGLLNIGSIILASQFGLNWIYVAVAVAVLQIISPITKFCPVYTILNKLSQKQLQCKMGNKRLIIKQFITL